MKDFAGEEVTIRIFDNVGRRLTFEQTIVATDEETRLDLSRMDSGVYNLFIHSAEHQITKRLVIANVTTNANSAR